MSIPYISTRLAIDIVDDKCSVFLKRYGSMEIIFSSEKAFDALNYMISIFTNEPFYISDAASLWIEMESHEQCAYAMKQCPYLFESTLDSVQTSVTMLSREEPEFI